MAKKNNTKKNNKNGRQKRLHIFTNSYCNNGCLFCSDIHKQSQLNSDRLKACAIRDLKVMRLKVNAVLFSSGEPTLSSNLLGLIELAKKLGYKGIGLVTNGRKLADKKFCEKLFQAGLTEINVSLHGSRKEIHERLTRVPGSFNETFVGLCNLSFLKKKYNFEFYVNFLLNKINYKDLDSFLRLLFTFDGLNGIVLNTVLPEGRAEQYFEAIIPQYSKVGIEIRKTMKRIKTIGIRHPDIFILGLPQCVLKGVESSIIIHEPAMRRKSVEEKNEKPSLVNWPARIKRVACQKCKFFTSCEGVWNSYVKKKGWKEFKPVII